MLATHDARQVQCSVIVEDCRPLSHSVADRSKSKVVSAAMSISQLDSPGSGLYFVHALHLSRGLCSPYGRLGSFSIWLQKCGSTGKTCVWEDTFTFSGSCFQIAACSKSAATVQVYAADLPGKPRRSDALPTPIKVN